MLEIITFSLLNGVVYGLLLFMVSSGLTLIFSLMGVLNFAHASMFMLGAYFSWQIGKWIGFWPALAIAPLLVARSAPRWNATACVTSTGKVMWPRSCSRSDWPISSSSAW
jgi:branched-subunit amino acid ABC-type transport system permease component